MNLKHGALGLKQNEYDSQFSQKTNMHPKITIIIQIRQFVHSKSIVRLDLNLSSCLYDRMQHVSSVLYTHMLSFRLGI